jgi:AmiR/NasT family two-component response regulator
METLRPGSCKVLLVEDESIIARDISSRLTRSGFTVIGNATSCEEVLQLLDTKYTNPYGFISKPVDDHDMNINLRNALYRFDAEKKLRSSRISITGLQKIQKISFSGTLISIINSIS